MSISIHKVGLNKTLGQQSDEIITTNLVGKWVGGTGVETLYWDNQVTDGKNLRRFNGISANDNYFAFDGTNDYLGEASTSYGGDPFTFNTNNAFTIGMWLRSGTNGQKFYFESWHALGRGFWFEITSASVSNNIKMDTNNGHITIESKADMNFSTETNENGVNSAHQELAKKFFSLDRLDKA